MYYVGILTNRKTCNSGIWRDCFWSKYDRNENIQCLPLQKAPKMTQTSFLAENIVFFPISDYLWISFGLIQKITKH